MSTNLTFSLTFKGMILGINATYRARTPDVRYLPNGDPGDPGDPEEVEFNITSVNVDDLETAIAASYTGQSERVAHGQRRPLQRRLRTVRGDSRRKERPQPRGLPRGTGRGLSHGRV